MVNCGSITGTRPWVVERGQHQSARQTKSLFREDSAAGILPRNINQAASITENVVMFRSVPARCIM